MPTNIELTIYIYQAGVPSYIPSFAQLFFRCRRTVAEPWTAKRRSDKANTGLISIFPLVFLFSYIVFSSIYYFVFQF
jgi:hypothetical protein